ncbi:hypothetical protein [Microbacterium sp. NPDC087589]|uniref:hypothetical protein n=1 Tax=Microbacterium sp. NPDC087589 TaxID=3364191 RepID=UPI003800A132
MLLLLWADQRRWAKPCFEYSPDRKPTPFEHSHRGAEAEHGQTRIGLEAQIPVGEGCDAQFDAIEFASMTLSDLRDGS